jgi:2-oxoglutarate ferredoxin oxidoreductase subunit beta
MVNVLDVCGIATLHGRSIPFASGVKSARPELTVIAQAGDGGLLSEGLNHFIHAIQRNDPIVLIVNNNLIFGLTAGQPSCATPKEVGSSYVSDENRLAPLSIVDLAVVNGALG